MFEPNRRRFRIPIIIVFTIALLTTFLVKTNIPAIAQSVSDPVLSHSEIRGVWLTNVDSDVLFNRATLRRSLRQLAQFHFNTLYPTVWNWGYTLYPSETARQATGYLVDPRPSGLQGRDVLTEMVRQGHRRGLAVIPWFEFGFMTDATTDLARQHPEWLTQRQDGSQLWQDGIYQRYWLNPFQPEVQNFILGLILEIVTRYDIDGIQFDDHLGLPREFGYDPYTVQLYRQEHNGQSPPVNTQDAEWVSWRANKITLFMTQVFQAIKAQKHHVLISLSPNNYAFSLNAFLQDWRTWERRGLIEELILQVYSSDRQRFIAELDRPEVQESRRHIPTGVGILTGLKDRTVPIRQVQEQVQIVREKGFPGMSFFFYETLWNLTSEQPSDRQAAFQTFFTAPAFRPNLLQGWSPPA
jgi:uncharacterized lipoprotein YddW (UPF0748 family)